MDRHAYMQAYWADYRTRKKLIKFWVSLPAAADLKRVALAEGKRPAVVARELLEAGLKDTAYVPQAIERELVELNRLLKNIANNINQQTRYAHHTRQPVDPVQMLAHLRTLHQHVAAFTQHQLDRSTSHRTDADQEHVP